MKCRYCEFKYDLSDKSSSLYVQVIEHLEQCHQSRSVIDAFVV